MSTLHPFHLAFPVHDLAQARAFYGGVLGCPEGRSSEDWVDFDFFGHQIVAHLVQGASAERAVSSVDHHNVPIPHFGIAMPMDDWRALAERLRAAGVHFEMEPQIRFAGQVGEQGTMFFLDPSGNALEIKGFADLGSLFKK